MYVEIIPLRDMPIRDKMFDGKMASAAQSLWNKLVKLADGEHPLSPDTLAQLHAIQARIADIVPARRKELAPVVNDPESWSGRDVMG